MGQVQSRRHGGDLVGLAPQTNLEAPPNWNMKHYKSVEFLLDLNVKPPLQKCQAPRTNLKPPYWRLYGDGFGQVPVLPTLVLTPMPTSVNSAKWKLCSLLCNFLSFYNYINHQRAMWLKSITSLLLVCARIVVV